MNREKILERAVKSALSLAECTPFTPYLDVISNDRPRRVVLETETMEEALQIVDRTLTDNSNIEYYIFTWDAFITIENGQKSDAALIELGFKGEPKSQVFAQLYEKNGDEVVATEAASKLDERPNRLMTQPLPFELSQSEYDFIKMLPAFIFILISGSDGSIDDKEIQTFREILEKPESVDDPFVAAIYQHTAQNFSSYIGNLLQSKFMQQPEAGLAIAARTIDEKIPGDTNRLFKQSLLDLAEKVASASGGIFGFGSKIGKEEKSMLKTIRAYLEV